MLSGCLIVTGKGDLASSTLTFDCCRPQVGFLVAASWVGVRALSLEVIDLAMVCGFVLSLCASICKNLLLIQTQSICLLAAAHQRGWQTFSSPWKPHDLKVCLESSDSHSVFFCSHFTGLPCTEQVFCTRMFLIFKKLSKYFRNVKVSWLLRWEFRASSGDVG